MKVFKNLIIITFVLLIGIYIGLYIYRHKNIKAEKVLNNYTIYLLQYGVYNNKENMIESGKKISDYFYFKDKDGYHIIIGVIENKELVEKIKKAFNIETDIYLKETIINNNEFIEGLRQYDSLVKELDSDIAIVNTMKQVLSTYEELIVNNE